jgi:hypothetical protein
MEGVVSQLPDIVLVSNGIPVFRNTTLYISPVKAGRVIVTAVAVPPALEPVETTP